MVNVYFKYSNSDELKLSLFDKKKLLSLFANKELEECELKYKKGNFSVKGKITENAYDVIKKMGIKIYIIKDSD